MKDVVERIEEVESDCIESIKGKTYEAIGSNPSKWKPAHIIGFIKDKNGQDQPVYHKGSIEITENESSKSIHLIHDEDDYRFVETPYSIIERSDGYISCDLCGHGIKNVHILINYEDKLIMGVGSVCIGHHYGKVIKKKLKIFKDNEIRKEFIELRDRIIPVLESKKDRSDEWHIANNRLEYWAWCMKEEINKIEPEKTGSRKLKNRIEKMKKVLEPQNEKKETGIFLNGKRMSDDDELSYEIEKATHPKMYSSLSHIQSTWCKCYKCGEGREFCVPDTALAFISCHKRSCGEDIRIDVTTDKSVCLAPIPKGV